MPTEPPSTWAVTQVPWRNAAGQLQGVISIAHDITARQAYEQHLAYLASHDALTGLPNRQALEIALILPPESAPAALLFIDLDHFHLVNDTLGHPLGDHVLVALAARLAEACAPEAVLARLGGDEFGALVPHTPLEGALVVAERVRAVVAARPFEVEGHTLELSVSIGVVAVVPGTAPGSAVVAAGEIAMYRAKRLGGNQVQAAQRPDDNAPALTTVTTWIGRLKRALAEDRFHLYFQPVVRVATGVVSHYEVLVRLPDGTGRLFSPDSFIPVAERHGLMGALDRWVADRVLTTLREQPTLAVFMNLSARSLSDVGLRDHLLAELISHPGLANRLGFEITETAVVEDVGRAVAWMAPLQACGCRFALDDFGAGFTSIAYVAQLPVTHLKLDRALIAPLGQDAASQGIVQALHLLGQALGKEMVAEGVETVGQWAVVQRLGFTYAQGYYLGRPAAQPDPLLEPRRASQGGSADGPGTPGVRAR